ncbi:MAG: chromate efflux transporter [Cytophagaceae bacterium]|nr:chromate efflux transporter [Cytophagaceae bacterium]
MRVFRPPYPRGANVFIGPQPVRRIRYFIFLKDVAVLALTTFGGPQVHLAMFLDRLVKRRAYLSEEELLELNALCQILPGPTSTQTITALGFKIGGPNLAYLTLLVWVTPAVAIMTLAALGIDYLQDRQLSLQFTRFIQPMAVGFVAHAGYQIGRKVIHNRLGVGIMLISAMAAYLFRSPWVCPAVLLLAGSITARRYQALQKEQKQRMTVQWANFILFVGVLIASAALGALTRNLPVRLFENFYRNGSLVFGGGQVLAPMLYTEFVEFKHYLSRQEFLSGLALSQVVPGPVFSIASYIGVLSMRQYGLGGKLLGSAVASAGIFLPGTFLIYFVYRFWNQLKRYRVVRASLEGINAASTGLTVAAAVLLFEPIATDWVAVLTVLATVALLQFTRVPHYAIIAAGLILGVVIR